MRSTQPNSPIGQIIVLSTLLKFPHVRTDTICNTNSTRSVSPLGAVRGTEWTVTSNGHRVKYWGMIPTGVRVAMREELYRYPG